MRAGSARCPSATGPSTGSSEALPAEWSSKPNNSTESRVRNLPSVGSHPWLSSPQPRYLGSARSNHWELATLLHRHQESRQAFGQEGEEPVSIHVFENPSVRRAAAPVYVAHRPSQGVLASKLDRDMHVPPFEQLRLQ